MGNLENKIRLAVLFGGVSSEHEISEQSAFSVCKNLDSRKYEIYKVGITKAGTWFLYTGSDENILNGNWTYDNSNVPAALSPDRSKKVLLAFRKDGYEELPVDVVFPVLHGKNGEDGTIQGLCTLAGIPYVGCETTPSAVCMDKAITHTLLSAANIEQTHYLWFYADRFEKAPDIIKDKIEARLTFPVFVKPANAGSSVGISRVENKEDLDAAILKASKEDKKILVENSVIGQEVECAVLGNRDAMASSIGEIGASATFYDYDDKYVNGTSQQIIPANISEETARKIQSIAVRVYRLLGCTGLARVDFFVTEDNRIVLNEINTMPGFTNISMYSKLWIHDGLSYSGILDRLILLALEKDTVENV
jgi:D-alanine--D-alanine ligase